MGEVLRPGPQRDRGAGPHAQDGQDHPQVCTPAAQAGAGRPHPACDQVCGGVGGVQSHRYMVGWGECSRTGMWWGGGSAVTQVYGGVGGVQSHRYVVGECFGINHTHLQLLVDLLCPVFMNYCSM